MAEKGTTLVVPDVNVPSSLAVGPLEGVWG